MDPRGRAGFGAVVQAKLAEQEATEVDERDRTDMARYGWQPGCASMVWPAGRAGLAMSRRDRPEPMSLALCNLDLSFDQEVVQIVDEVVELLLDLLGGGVEVGDV